MDEFRKDMTDIEFVEWCRNRVKKGDEKKIELQTQLDTLLLEPAAPPVNVWKFKGGSTVIQDTTKTKREHQISDLRKQIIATEESIASLRKIVIDHDEIVCLKQQVEELDQEVARNSAAMYTVGSII